MQLHGLTKKFADTTAVDNLSLDVAKGEFVSLLGPSGCGKTTTLQMIAGFVDVTAGSIILDGTDITFAKPNERGLGIVFQTYALFPHMTVEKNVAFGLEMRKVSGSDIARRVRDALAVAQLEKFAQRYPRELSGGQRQRVALARALVIQPPVLLLDEPLSNLDANLREEMQFELRRIQQQAGTTTIMVTHDQAEALSVSDRVVVMREGKVIQIDEPYVMYENPATPFISRFVGKTNTFAVTVTATEQGTHFDLDGQRITLKDNANRTSHAETSSAGTSEALVSVRPEKIVIDRHGQGRFAGTVKNSFFLGNLWMYEVQTAFGLVVVSVINNHQQVYKIGEDVSLDWHEDALRVLTAEPAGNV
ncbi:putative spermidine/putrescine import ATP-binding protein PotA [Advenella mimigardefordensis DPN7]|uniref:Spermidine/putrescine import ATP-binding protein PotA n=1 Tax=Advenella mimigardefordensis (strain DSM 17166 / LMG 22922 / DPN7) TaxID=1247726 RepID=W0PH70_ADVMD|nr:putative spermidine/putrescine import ATP-binding protein PotA [Advenella mimigardefordensis DPN7]